MPVVGVECFGLTKTIRTLYLQTYGLRNTRYAMGDN